MILTSIEMLSTTIIDKLYKILKLIIYAE